MQAKSGISRDSSTIHSVKGSAMSQLNPAEGEYLDGQRLAPVVADEKEIKEQVVEASKEIEEKAII